MGIKPPKRINKRKWIVITAIALIHFVSSVLLVFMSFGSTMSRFETGVPATQDEQLVGLGVNIMTFPLVSLALLPNFPFRIANGILGWLIYVVNSFLWGMGIYSLGQIFIKIFTKKNRDRQ